MKLRAIRLPERGNKTAEEFLRELVAALQARDLEILRAVNALVRNSSTKVRTWVGL